MKKAIEGVKTVFRKMHHYFMVKTNRRLCSGYRVYPDGLKCPGCTDCKPWPKTGREATKKKKRNILGWIVLLAYVCFAGALMGAASALGRITVEVWFK